MVVLGVIERRGGVDDLGRDRAEAGAVEPLLERLAAFNPNLIAIENLSGESIHALKAYEAIYPKSASSYGGRLMKGAAMAEAVLKLALPEAEAESRRVLNEWPDQPTAAQRRHLAALFTAAGDTHSALVQWWRLPEAGRIPGDGVSSDLAAYFAERAAGGVGAHARTGAAQGFVRAGGGT